MRARAVVQCRPLHIEAHSGEKVNPLWMHHSASHRLLALVHGVMGGRAAPVPHTSLQSVMGALIKLQPRIGRACWALRSTVLVLSCCDGSELGVDVEARRVLCCKDSWKLSTGALVDLMFHDQGCCRIIG